MHNPKENLDQELDPKRLKFGMSLEERKGLERKVRVERKKPAKTWRPGEH